MVAMENLQTSMDMLIIMAVAVADQFILLIPVETAAWAVAAVAQLVVAVAVQGVSRVGRRALVVKTEQAIQQQLEELEELIQVVVEEQALTKTAQEGLAAAVL
jgi:cellulose biosynthesis protein BcsQ